MEQSFILSCESTVDLPYSYVSGRGLPVLFYSYTVNGREYPDDMGRDPAALPNFYSMLRTQIPSTAQLNEFAYEQFFAELLEQGDVLHIALGTGMTQSVENARAAAAALAGSFPGRRLEVIDSLCSSSGYGLLVDAAADLRDEGRSLDEVVRWVMDNRRKVHHQFYSTDLQYYRRSGRMSGTAATVGAVLNICPIMRLDDGGRIIAYDKVRGKRKARERTLEMMLQHARGGADYAEKCFICHSDCVEEAAALRDLLAAHFPHIKGEIRVCDIGTIIASHCGPGTVAVFFFGDEREPYQK